MDACHGLSGKDSPSLAGCMSGNHLKIFFSNLFSVFFSLQNQEEMQVYLPLGLPFGCHHCCHRPGKNCFLLTPLQNQLKYKSSLFNQNLVHMPYRVQRDLSLLIFSTEAHDFFLKNYYLGTYHKKVTIAY